MSFCVPGASHSDRELGMDLYYTVLSAPCQSVYLVAKYLGIELNLKHINVREYMKKVKSKYHMRNCIPTLVDGNFVLSESRAIMTYLVNKYAPDNPVYPTNCQKRAIVERLMYYDMGTLFFAIGEYFKPQVFMNESPDRSKEEKMRESCQYIESLLSETTYVAGDAVTLADMCVGVSLALVEECDYDLSDFPRIRDYIRRLTDELPYYKELKSEWKVELKMYLDKEKECQPCVAKKFCSMLCKKP